METYKYINKTVYYLKAAEDGFCYLSLMDVFAVSEKNLYNKDFSKCVAINDIFEHYEDAQAYMNALGMELYLGENKVGFKKIYKSNTDVR